jgi:hypothetical protein
MTLLGGAEEAVEGFGGLLWSFFREEVTGSRGMPSNIVAPGPPERY